MRVIFIVGSFILGLSSVAYSQDFSSNEENKINEENQLEQLNPEKGSSLQVNDSAEAEKVIIIGRNLRNSDGTEMGSFVISGDGNVSRSSLDREKFLKMPPQGFDNEAYARDMRKIKNKE